MMTTLKFTALAGALVTLAACGQTDLERGVSGAAIGAGAAQITGEDVATGAAVGAVAGVFCDDAGVCR